VEDLEEKELSLLLSLFQTIGYYILDEDIVQTTFKACEKALTAQEFLENRNGPISVGSANQLSILTSLWRLFKGEQDFNHGLVIRVLSVEIISSARCLNSALAFLSLVI
jgi:hypothetical protein